MPLKFDRDGIELLWIQIHVGLYPVMFGVFYCPPGSHLLELRSSLFTIPRTQFSFVVISTYQRQVGMICP